MKRSFGRYSPSFSDLPCPNLKKKKREEVESRGWPRKERGKKRPSTPGSKTEYPDTGVSFNDFASLFDWHGERRG